MASHHLHTSSELSPSSLTITSSRSSSTMAAPQITSLSDLSRELRKAFEADKLDVDHVRGLMEAYQSSPDDWSKFVTFSEAKYTRNLIDKGNGKYYLIVLCWGPNQGAPIHSHGGSQCFLKILDGELLEVQYKWPETDGQQMEEKQRTTLKVNDMGHINDDTGLHSEGNKSATKAAVSLHLYFNPYNNCFKFNEATGAKEEIKMKFDNDFTHKLQ